LLEGQSGLRNPSGPCGSELLLSGAARGVVLQHAPGRRHVKGLERLGVPMPRLDEEIDLIRRYGVEVWAITLHHEGLDAGEAEDARARVEHETGLVTVLPLVGGVDRVAERIRAELCGGRTE
jgi:uncharacterized NAD-dependent epimerase/dehydratase family protein